MKIRTISCVILLWFAGAQPALAEIGGQSGFEETQARSAVTHYMDALFRGDTGTLHRMLTGEFLQRKDQILTNPAYRRDLVNMYRKATFRITGAQPLDDRRIAVDVRLQVSSQEHMDVRFYLIRMGSSGNFRIYDEEELGAR